MTLVSASGGQGTDRPTNKTKSGSTTGMAGTTVGKMKRQENLKDGRHKPLLISFWVA
jgi:hypothetical protein